MIRPEYTNLIFLYLAEMVMAFCGYYVLMMAQNSSIKNLRALFYIPARKSATNAVQFGGLPLALIITASGLTLYFTHGIFPDLTATEKNLWLIGMLSGVGIIIYGYLDDKFELRPVIKLAAQFTTISLFALLGSRVVYPHFSAFAFLILSFYGLGLLNGGNLLDGLDTLMIKLGSVTYIQYICLAFYFDTPSLLMTTGLCWVPLLVFYFFNREPAKIHLGEIGGSYLGFTHLILACQLFHLLTKSNQAPYHASQFNAVFLALMPLTLPMTELGVSFLRRLMNGKSPFKGDKFHVHHILHNYWKMAPRHVASWMAIGYFSAMMTAYAIGLFVHPFAGYLSGICLVVGLYWSIGHSYWVGKDTIELSAKTVFDVIRKKDVVLIDTSMIDDFTLTILSDSDEKNCLDNEKLVESEKDQKVS